MMGTTVDKAALYEAHRLPYAAEAAGNLLSEIGFVSSIADVGAGTGQLSRLFAAQDREVWCVEPDAAMRSIAESAVGSLPGVLVVAGSAEESGLSTDSVDLVVIGDAFHRFRPEARHEIRHVLRSEGWVALFSNPLCDGTFFDSLFENLASLPQLTERIGRAWHRTPVEELFLDAEIRCLTVLNTHHQDWDAFFGAACSGIEAPEATDAEFGRFEQMNREFFETKAVDGVLELSYQTEVSYGQPPGIPAD